MPKGGLVASAVRGHVGAGVEEAHRDGGKVVGAMLEDHELRGSM
jgi:hypothetical protein